jgi:uncharacterized protein (TIGR03066 family)
MIPDAGLFRTLLAIKYQGHVMHSLAVAGCCFTALFAVVGCGGTGGSSPKAAAVASSGGTRPQDMIVGTWEAIGPEQAKRLNAVFEFKADGTMLITMATGATKITTNGKYKFVADDTMETEAERLGGKDKKKVKVEVAGDTLVLTTGPGGMLFPDLPAEELADVKQVTRCKRK